MCVCVEHHALRTQQRRISSALNPVVPGITSVISFTLRRALYIYQNTLLEVSDTCPKTSLKSLEYICRNNQQYIVWVKIIDFSFMPKIIRILKSCFMKIFLKTKLLISNMHC